MAEFRKCFHAIDTENTGVITVEALRSYMQRMHYKEQFVSKWISLFDPKNEGVITYEGYCKTLGLIPKRREEDGADQARKKPQEGPKPTTSSVPTQVQDAGEKSAPSGEQPKLDDKPVVPTPPPPESPKTTEEKKSKPKKEKRRKTKRSQSEKSDESVHEDVPESSESVEEPIVPIVHPVTIPSKPTAEILEVTEQPVSEKTTETQKAKKTRSPHLSISSQPEDSQTLKAEVTEPETVISDAVVTQQKMPPHDTSEPMEVDEIVQPEPSQKLAEAQPPKQKGRKHKISLSRDELKHLPQPESPEVSLAEPLVDEQLVSPVQLVDTYSVPPVEEDQKAEVEPGKEMLLKSHPSQSETDAIEIDVQEQVQVQSPVPESADLISATTETQVPPFPDEQPMEIVEEVTAQPITPVQSKVHSEPVAQEPSPSVKPIKTDKGRKPKAPESDSMEESGGFGDSTLRSEPPTEKIIESKKKPRQKKSSQSPSGIHREPETEITSEPVDGAIQMPVVHDQVEPQQSTTPLDSPLPIAPSEQHVCISQVDSISHSPLLHDVTQAMELQQLTAAETKKSAVTNIVTKSSPQKTRIAPEAVTKAKPKSPEPMETVESTIPVKEMATPATNGKPGGPKLKSDKKQPKSSPPTTQLERAQQKERSKPEQKQPESQMAAAKEEIISPKPQQKAGEKAVKPKQQKVPKPPKIPKPAETTAEPQKKAEKRKHEEISKRKEREEIKSDTTSAAQTKAKVYDPTLDKLTRVKRPHPIPARLLRDKKPSRSIKTEKETKDVKESEKKQRTSRFPKSFMVQPDGIRSIRQRRLALRQHERRLQRKIERLEKVKRKSASKFRPKYPWKVRPSLRSRGVVVILLGGQHRGKRVVCLGRQRSTGLLLVTGPFKYNGCPLRRVHPNMVIATRTSVDLSKFSIPLRMHKKEYFARKRTDNKRRKLDDALLLKPDGGNEDGYKPSEQRKADQKLVDAAVCKAIKAHEESRMLVKYLKSLFSLGKYDHPHTMIF